MAIEPIPPDDPERSYPPDEAALKAFYDSWEWKKLAYAAKTEHGWHCRCCGASADDGVRIVTDHIKPIRFYWHLRFERSNLTVLCDDCNKGKASWDETDYSKSTKERLLGAIEYCEAHDRGTPLKAAIIAAHSFGALTDEETADLIRRNGLEAS